MTEVLGGFRDIPTESPIITAIDYSQPGPGSAVAIRVRGIWAAGTLYNPGDAAIYTGDGSRLLLLCLEQHVAAGIFDRSKWGVLVDLAGLTAGVSEEQLIDAVNQANISADDAEAARLAALEIRDQLENDAEDLAEKVAEATLARDEAIAVANAPRGTEVPGGGQSARASAEIALEAAQVAAIIPTMRLTNANGPTWAVDATGDAGPAGNQRRSAYVRFRDVLCENTSLLTIELVQGQFTDPAVDGSPGLAWFEVVAAGSANVEIEGAGGTTTVAPNLLASIVPMQRNFTATSSPALSSSPQVRNPTFSLPAGQNRAAFWQIISIFDQVDVARDVTLSVAGATATTEITSDTTTAAYNTVGGDPINITQYWSTFPDSNSSTALTTTVTLPTRCVGYMIIFWPLANVGGYDAASVKAQWDQVAAAAHSNSLVSDTVKSLALGIILWQGGDVTPITALSSNATQRATGRSAGTRSAQDVSYVCFSDVHESAGSQTYSATAAASRQRGFAGVVVEPVGGGGSAVTLLPAGPIVLTPGEQAVVKCHSDGLRYFVSKSG